MNVNEFREFVRDRVSNACGDPMGMGAAVDDIVGQWQRDVDKAYDNPGGYDRRQASE
jgi:hypothetical protein